MTQEQFKIDNVVIRAPDSYNRCSQPLLQKTLKEVRI